MDDLLPAAVRVVLMIARVENGGITYLMYLRVVDVGSCVLCLLTGGIMMD
jgi:hypothetical protein